MIQMYVSFIFYFIYSVFVNQDEDDENTGEEIRYIEKHVEFTDELNNDEENLKDQQTQQKLHRRDTPHHLKNKRIVNKNNDSINFDVKKFNSLGFCF